MATTGMLGRVNKFVSSRDDWPQYVERLEYFFVANGITDAGKKRAVLLSIMGAAIYKMLRNILSLVKLGEKTYAELVEKLTMHFKPAPSDIVERLKFHSRVRKAGELVSACLAELHLALRALQLW